MLCFGGVCVAHLFRFLCCVLVVSVLLISLVFCVCVLVVSVSLISLVFCIFVLFLVCPMLLVFLECPASVFSNVYLHTMFDLVMNKTEMLLT